MKRKNSFSEKSSEKGVKNHKNKPNVTVNRDTQIQTRAHLIPAFDFLSIVFPSFSLAFSLFHPTKVFYAEGNNFCVFYTGHTASLIDSSNGTNTTKEATKNKK